jgi:hypothetical protein
MTKAPTDLEILDAIYERYYGDFALDSVVAPTRGSKIQVPIDCKAIAKELGTDPDIIFGRLYYDLERRYGYKQTDGSAVCFFALKSGDDRHTINFPYLASVVASLRAEHRRQLTATTIAIISIVIAMISLAISLYGAAFLRAVA